MVQGGVTYTGAYTDSVVVVKTQNTQGFVGYKLNALTTATCTVPIGVTAEGVGNTRADPAGGWGTITSTSQTTTSNGTLTLRLKSAVASNGGPVTHNIFFEIFS